jgi:ABC-2 type transport system permease protein
VKKLFVASVKMLYRDRQSLFWALAFPVIFVVVFGLFDFNQAPNVRIDVVGADRAPIGSALIQGLDRVGSFDVHRTASGAAARRSLMDGDVDVVLLVPAQASATGSSDVEVLYNGSNFTTNQFALTTIRQIVDGMNLRASGISRPPLVVQTRAVQAKTVDYYDFILPGLVAMGVMNISIVGMGVAVARYREQRILKRILATPLRPIRFLSAQVLARLLLSVVQSALILGVGVFAFGGHVYGNVLWLFVLVVLGNLVFLNLGFAVAGVASNPDAAQGLGQALALPMMFFSGVFFPIESLPRVVETLVRYLPLTPLLDAMRAVAIDGKSITATGVQLLQLGIWVLVSFALATRLFRFSEAR